MARGRGRAFVTCSPSSYGKMCLAEFLASPLCVRGGEIPRYLLSRRDIDSPWRRATAGVFSSLLAPQGTLSRAFRSLRRGGSPETREGVVRSGLTRSSSPRFLSRGSSFFFPSSVSCVIVRSISFAGHETRTHIFWQICLILKKRKYFISFFCIVFHSSQR